MVLRTTGSVLAVFLWSLTVVAVVLGQSVTYTSQKICALKGSTVDLSCSYTNPWGYTVKTNAWYYWMSRNWNKIPDMSTGRLSYRGNKDNDCTLRITDLRKEDSASYCFSSTPWHATEYVYLRVTDLQVKVSGYNMKTLICSTSCILSYKPTYIWYKNGQPVIGHTSIFNVTYFNDDDRYSCAVKGHESLRSPAVCNKYCVTYSSQSICALKGSTVDLFCSYTYPSYYEVKTTEWNYWKNQDWKKVSDNYAGRVSYLGNKDNDCTLRITDLREEDSTSYKLISSPWYSVKDDNVSLTVTDVVLEMEPTSVSERNRVTLTCTTKCSLDPNPEYSWYKNGQPIENGNTYSTVHILSVSSEDAGRYSCGVKGHETPLSPEKTLYVTYAPKNTSVSVSTSGEIVDGSSVTLTCSSDANPPVDKYTWYKKTFTSPKASGQSYSITNITSEDSGEYYCEAENEYGRLNSSSVFVDVHYGPKNPSVSVSPSGEIVEGSSVTLTCSSDANPPVDKYTWYKKTVTSPKASGQSYNITNITSEDRGEYYCEAENGIGSMKSTVLMIIVAGQSSALTASEGIIVVVLVLILCLSGFIWFRKKAPKSTSDTRDKRSPEDNRLRDSSLVYDNVSGMVTVSPDNQEDQVYTNVPLSYPHHQEEALYSTVQMPPPQNQDANLLYTVVKFNSTSGSTRPAAPMTEEDPSVIYSTVNKPGT